MIWSDILAFTGDVNIYGPLWTPACICTGWTDFSCFSYIFPYDYHPKDIITSPHHWHSHDGLLSSPQHHVQHQPPIVSFFTPHSPVICKDFFSLVYLYKSSGYYTITSLETGSTAAYQALGLYCQWLPRLSTKSIHYYLYLLYFHTRLTSLSLRNTASKCYSSPMPLNLLAPSLQHDCHHVPKFPQPWDPCASIINRVLHQAYF